jgi:hypothetical protein
MLSSLVEVRRTCQPQSILGTAISLLNVSCMALSCSVPSLRAFLLFGRLRSSGTLRFASRAIFTLLGLLSARAGAAATRAGAAATRAGAAATRAGAAATRAGAAATRASAAAGTAAASRASA